MIYARTYTGTPRGQRTCSNASKGNFSSPEFRVSTAACDSLGSAVANRRKIPPLPSTSFLSLAAIVEQRGLTRWTSEPVDWQDTQGGEDSGVRLSNRELHGSVADTWTIWPLQPAGFCKGERGQPHSDSSPFPEKKILLCIGQWQSQYARIIIELMCKNLYNV